MAPRDFFKTTDFSNFTPVTLTPQDMGKRFILVNGNIRQIGTFNKFSPDLNRVYFTFDGKSSPISVSVDPLNGYKVYSVDNISQLETSTLTNLPPDLQQNIAGYYGGKRVKRKSRRSKRTKRKSKKSRKTRKSV
jgi:hypothetical protein